MQVEIKWIKYNNIKMLTMIATPMAVLLWASAAQGGSAIIKFVAFLGMRCLASPAGMDSSWAQE